MASNVISSRNCEGITRACQYVMTLPKRMKENIVDFAIEAKKLGQDDPRRIYHALKVGLAITVVSLFYYFQPLYDGFGVSAMWAVITVVVIFEFTVGFLGVLAHYLADLSGNIGEPILLALFGFIVAATMTFMRFFPKLKAKYDYGLMIFILTFALVSVSGYRDDEVIKIAQQRLSTIIIGSCIAILICTLISPVWSGSELHNLIASNIDKLANFFEGFGSDYMKITDEKSKEQMSFRQQYKSVLNSKTTEESMEMKKTSTTTTTTKTQLKETKAAAQELKNLLQDTSLWGKCNLLEILPAATVASILIEVVDCVENITEEVHELASMLNFKADIDKSSAVSMTVQQETELSGIIIDGEPHHATHNIAPQSATKSLSPVSQTNMT
ncbi:Aluminum-activated malate transporter 2 [Bienertia sinuspersici]